LSANDLIFENTTQSLAFKFADGRLAFKGFRLAECSPDLPRFLFLTFAGFAGQFAPFNGKHQVDHGFGVADNQWADIGIGFTPRITLAYVTSPLLGWTGSVLIGCLNNLITLSESPVGVPCTPVTSLVFNVCIDSCSPGDCAASAAATGSVTLS